MPRINNFEDLEKYFGEYPKSLDALLFALLLPKLKFAIECIKMNVQNMDQDRLKLSINNWFAVYLFNYILEHNREKLLKLEEIHEALNLEADPDDFPIDERVKSSLEEMIINVTDLVIISASNFLDTNRNYYPSYIRDSLIRLNDQIDKLEERVNPFDKRDKVMHPIFIRAMEIYASNPTINYKKSMLQAIEEIDPQLIQDENDVKIAVLKFNRWRYDQNRWRNRNLG